MLSTMVVWQPEMFMYSGRYRAFLKAGAKPAIVVVAGGRDFGAGGAGACEPCLMVGATKGAPRIGRRRGRPARQSAWRAILRKDEDNAHNEQR